MIIKKNNLPTNQARCKISETMARIGLKIRININIMLFIGPLFQELSKINLPKATIGKNTHTSPLDAPFWDVSNGVLGPFLSPSICRQTDFFVVSTSTVTGAATPSAMAKYVHVHVHVRVYVHGHGHDLRKDQSQGYDYGCGQSHNHSHGYVYGTGDASAAIPWPMGMRQPQIANL